MRREGKPEIAVPRKATFALGYGERRTGRIVRISLAGVELEAPDRPRHGVEVALRTELIEGEGELEMHGRVQWSGPMRFGVQFTRVGVRETYAILRLSRHSAG